MDQKTVPPFPSADLTSQALKYTNRLSALYSIPLIEILYDSGCSIDQLEDLRAMFDILVSSSLYTDAFRLFLLIYQDVTNERPLPLYALWHSPILIPYFLFEFLDDYDSLLEEFMYEESTAQNIEIF